jgi:hypothetical protein
MENEWKRPMDVLSRPRNSIKKSFGNGISARGGAVKRKIT